MSVLEKEERKSMAADINEQLKDMTRCCICTEAYLDPRMLSCIHTFCLRCLQQIWTQSDKKLGDKLPCPVCRKEFVIPKEGMTGIQKNFFMDNLVEMTKIANPPEKAFCSFCLEDFEKLNEKVEGVPLATVYCIDCHDNLCDDCGMHHRKQKPTRNHQIVPLGSAVVPKQVAQLKSCNQHGREDLKMYCYDCKIAVCVLCYIESHKSHKCIDIHKIADDFRQKIGQDAQSMCQLLSEGTTRMTRLAEVRKDVNKKVELMEKEIRARAHYIKALIDKHLQSQLENLSTKKLTMLKKLDVDENETKQHLSIVESFQTYCNEVKFKGSPGDVCASANDLHTRTEELQQLHQSSSIRIPVAEFNCCFNKMDLEDILDLHNNNILGCIKDDAAIINFKTLDVKPSGNNALLGNACTNNPEQETCQRKPILRSIRKQGVQLEQFNTDHERAPRAVNNPDNVFPKYWRHRNLNPRGADSTYQIFQIDRDDQLYKELKDMFNCGLGNNPNQKRTRDSQWGQCNVWSRNIKKIWCLENALLYRKYADKKEEFRLNALVNTYRPLSALLGSDVSTLKTDTTLVTTSTLDRHINEYFLFHSATPETQEYISRKGFSSAPDACKRSLAGYAHENSFGSTGIHFRETIGTQEDIDEIDQNNYWRHMNVPNQSLRYVFVARVLLGNSYLCKEPRAFKRTPCMHENCHSDSCNHHLLSGSYDSVIRIAKSRYEYQGYGLYHAERSTFTTGDYCADDRDFLIYSPEQSYPDFLIEYQ